MLRQDKFVEVVGRNILYGEYLNNIVGALAGGGSVGGKAEGGGLIIAATLFFHEHVICLQRIVVRQGREKKNRLDKAIPSTTNSDDSSRIFPPLPRQGERGSRMLLPRGTIAADGRHVRQCGMFPSLRRL